MSSASSTRTFAWPAGVHPQHAAALRVLLVEDHADTRDLYAEWLGAGDYRVSVTGSAADAIVLAATDAPDVVVAELMMPGGGPSLIRALRAHPTTADALIIVLTTQGQPARRAEALAAGADIYAVKPCGAPRLAELIEIGRRDRDARIGGA